MNHRHHRSLASRNFQTASLNATNPSRNLTNKAT
ncbi:hypothetical protein OYT1_ch0179 [Ferriphaselus amnicola]|uniref:Uncharacterized protein n=1 Tax=Ferriphaselus amnicola TaxID=1188319 RepID=A0A2Z6G8N2_9PROT|nr:hypothetical protein OYT1_ch0179 [Ferriphaselus amnicola]